jgi:WD40 repeat protein
MTQSKRPYFRLESRFENGTAGAPELFNLEQVQGEWKMSRRAFVATSAALGALCAGLWTGKTRAQELEEGSLFEMEVLSSHTASVRAVAFSPNGKWLASGADDEKVKIWDVSSKALLKVIDTKMAVQCLCFTPDNRYVAAGGTARSNRSRLVIYDAESGDVYKKLDENTGSITALACDPEGKLLATGNKDKNVKLWDIRSGANRFIFRKHKGEILSLVFAADGKTFLSGSADQQIKIWDPKTGRVLKTLEGHSGPVHALSVSPDNKTIASGGAEQFIFLWDRYKGTVLNKIPTVASVYALAFSPNSMILVSGHADKVIRVWDGTTGYALDTLEGHTAAVQNLSFHPASILIASAGADKSVRIWNAAAGELLSILFDPAATAKGSSAISYKVTDLNGQSTGNVLPCRTPLPAGAVCTCHCVPGQYVPSVSLPAHSDACKVVCQCNKICTCIPVV